ARLDAAGKWPEAASLLGQAALLDNLSADLEFRWGKCLSGLANATIARAHFQKACDLDALPFRADSPINAAIRESATQFAGRGVRLCDASEFLATWAPADRPGQEIFYDH